MSTERYPHENSNESDWKTFLMVIGTNLMKNRKAYKSGQGEIYLDCIHCGVTYINNFGVDKRGFMGKRSECTPCRRRTKDVRDKIGSKTIIIVEGKPKEVTYYKVSQAKRFAFKDTDEKTYFICTVCREAKHSDDFYNETGGLLDKKSKCKPCTDIENNKWMEENYKYYLECHRKYYSKNKEEIRKKAKKFREENKQHIFIQRKAYRDRYKKRLYLKKKIYREENREKERERIKKWFSENPHKQFYYSQLRLARHKALPDTLTEQQLLEILERYNNKCCLTGEKAHLDHVIPLFIGHGGTIYENILPLSPVLNGSKQDKNIFEWAEMVHKVFGFTMERFTEVMCEIAERNDMTLDEYREYYYWCFDNPSTKAEKIIKQRKKEKEEFLTNIKKATEMYIAGVAIKEIEKVVGITNATIYRHLKIRGIKCDRRNYD